MCDPMTMMVVMGVMATAQSMIATNAQNQLAEEEGKATVSAATYDYQQLAEQRSEVDEKAAQEKLQRQLQTAREHGRIAVAVGEAGVGGTSTMRVMNNAFMQGSYDVSVIEANRMSKARQITSEMGAVQAKAKGRINIAKSKSVSRGAGLFQAGMAGISGGASGYMMGKSFSGKTMTKKPNVRTHYT